MTEGTNDKMKTHSIEIYEYLSKLVEYDKDTGIFTWKARESDKRWTSRYAGTVCGSFTGHSISTAFMYIGRRVVIQWHILAWYMTYGELPKDVIDHIDRNPKNNKISNLRDVPQSVNCRNRRMSTKNTSGVTGVTYSRKTNKWRAAMKLNGKWIHLGYFLDISDAAKVVFDARIANGFTENHGT